METQLQDIAEKPLFFHYAFTVGDDDKANELEYGAQAAMDFQIAGREVTRIERTTVTEAGTTIVTVVKTLAEQQLSADEYIEIVRDTNEPLELKQ